MDTTLHFVHTLALLQSHHTKHAQSNKDGSREPTYTNRPGDENQEVTRKTQEKVRAGLH